MANTAPHLAHQNRHHLHSDSILDPNTVFTTSCQPQSWLHQSGKSGNNIHMHQVSPGRFCFLGSQVMQILIKLHRPFRYIWLVANHCYKARIANAWHMCPNSLISSESSSTQDSRQTHSTHLYHKIIIKRKT
jgi:hypothetical protein